MNRYLSVLAVAATLAATAVPVNARDGRNAAAAAGVAAGLALGAVAAGAATPRTYYPGPNAYQVYESDPSECRVVTRRVCDDYGCRTRRREICD
jgi:hypothetical protein